MFRLVFVVFYSFPLGFRLCFPPSLAYFRVCFFSALSLFGVGCAACCLALSLVDYSTAAATRPHGASHKIFSAFLLTETSL